MEQQRPRRFKPYVQVWDFEHPCPHCHCLFLKSEDANERKHCCQNGAFVRHLDRDIDNDGYFPRFSELPALFVERMIAYDGLQLYPLSAPLPRDDDWREPGFRMDLGAYDLECVLDLTAFDDGMVLDDYDGDDDFDDDDNNNSSGGNGGSNYSFNNSNSNSNDSRTRRNNNRRNFTTRKNDRRKANLNDGSDSEHGEPRAASEFPPFGFHSNIINNILALGTFHLFIHFFKLFILFYSILLPIIIFFIHFL